ncbi:MAG: DUF4142 domain-containing protein [Pseudomonadota bacterium]|nr:DUF4142 domain-containing protein [Pseudomonadota bacterium]
MTKYWILGLVLAVGCLPEREERVEGEPGGVTPEGTAPERTGTDDATGRQGTDDATGTYGTDGTTGAPGTAAPGTMPGATQPRAGQESAAQVLTDLHQQYIHELALAGLAQEKATDPNIKSYADRITQERTQADTDLTKLVNSKGMSWAQADTTRYATQTATIERLRGLTGTDFEQAYVAEVLDAGDKTVAIVEQLTAVEDQDVKDYIDRIHPIVLQQRDAARQLKVKTGT